jgi:hypothetical protein
MRGKEKEKKAGKKRKITKGNVNRKREHAFRWYDVFS